MSAKKHRHHHHHIVIIDHLWDHPDGQGTPEIDLNQITICKNIRLYDEMVDHDLIKVWDKLKNKPLVIVFDLDLTLWPFWVDTHCDPPFKRMPAENDDHHTVVDQKNKVFTFYTDVPKILNTLRNYCMKEKGYLAVASKTMAGDDAMQLIELYEWKNHFNSFQMYGGTKTRHMKKICEELDVKNKHEILFFDDDKRNIKDTTPLGITSYLLNYRSGLTLNDCVNGLLMHENK